MRILFFFLPIFTLTISCKRVEAWESDDPVDFVESFIRQVNNGDTETVQAFLCPDLNDALKADNRRLREATGESKVDFTLLRLGYVFTGETAKIEISGEYDDFVTVSAVKKDGSSFPVRVRKLKNGRLCVETK